ncbi:MAG: DUF2244 domain-containing protein [Telluria sp.]
MPRDYLLEKREWLLKRNCSLTPRQTLLGYALLVTLSLAVGLLFLWHGAWPVLCYTFLEIAAVTAAYLYYSRHALDHEHVLLEPGRLLVELASGGAVTRVTLDPRATRVCAPVRMGELVRVQARSKCLSLGATLPPLHRLQFARELQRALASHSRASGNPW